MPEGASVQAETEPSASPEEALARSLFALANATRLNILQQIRRPDVLSGIRVERADGSGGALSRQAVREHLGRLVEAGAVLTVPDDSDGRRGMRYVTNHQHFYALAETLRDFSRIKTDAEVEQTTMVGGQRKSPFDLRGQSLVMVKGPDEGRVFALDAPADGKAEWIVGRARGVDIPLDHDAYVSSENTLLTYDDGAYFVSDLPHSRNGTRLNFQALPKGRSERLRTGDIIGIGQTLVMFRG